MISLAGAERGCLPDVLAVAAALNVQDPRERPRSALAKADEAQRRWRDERSDFVGLLRLWHFVREAERRSTGHLRRVCQENFLSFLRVREWTEIHRQLEDVVRELGLGAPAGGDKRGRPKGEERQGPDESAEALHRALLSGLISKVGHYHPEHRVYLGARQTRFALHPASGLARKPPQWIMAFELVETTQLFARTAAKIEPEWLYDAAPELLKRSYSDPHWSGEDRGEGLDQGAGHALRGLPVFRDSQRRLRERGAPPRRGACSSSTQLVRRRVSARAGRFQEQNRALFAEVARLRAKARRSDMMTGRRRGALRRLRPPRPGERGERQDVRGPWREDADLARDPQVLSLSLEDVLDGDPEPRSGSLPRMATLTLHGVPLPGRVPLRSDGRGRRDHPRRFRWCSCPR